MHDSSDCDSCISDNTILPISMDKTLSSPNHWPIHSVELFYANSGIKVVAYI